MPIRLFVRVKCGTNDKYCAGINNKFDLEVKDKEQFRDYKLQQALDEINREKLSVEHKITAINDQVAELEKQRAVLIERLDNLNKSGLESKRDASRCNFFFRGPVPAIVNSISCACLQRAIA